MNLIKVGQRICYTTDRKLQSESGVGLARRSIMKNPGGPTEKNPGGPTEKNPGVPTEQNPGGSPEKNLGAPPGTVL